MSVTVSMIRRVSVVGARMNSRRAGVLKNKCRTEIAVPIAAPVGCCSDNDPPSQNMRTASSRSRCRETTSKCETAAIDASASPRKPNEMSDDRSSRRVIFEVA